MDGERPFPRSHGNNTTETVLIMRPVHGVIIGLVAFHLGLVGGWFAGRFVEREAAGLIYWDLPIYGVEKCTVDGLVLRGPIAGTDYGIRKKGQPGVIYRVYGVPIKDDAEAAEVWRVLLKGETDNGMPLLRLIRKDSARSVRVVLHVGDKFYFLDQVWPVIRK